MHPLLQEGGADFAEDVGRGYGASLNDVEENGIGHGAFSPQPPRPCTSPGHGFRWSRRSIDRGGQTFSRPLDFGAPRSGGDLSRLHPRPSSCSPCSSAALGCAGLSLNDKLYPNIKRGNRPLGGSDGT